MNARLEDIRLAIRARYRSVYAFCRANPDLQRSTVYLILSGKYPGNTDRQAAKIQKALSGKIPAQNRPVINAQEAYGVLQEAKCAYCRKLDKRGCPECKTQTTREAQALEQYLCERGEA